MNAAFRRHCLLLFASAAALALAACGNEPPPAADGRLPVVVRTTPAAWYFEGDRAKGIDHDLLAKFAGSLGLEPEVSYAANTTAALDALCNPRAQLAVGLLTLPPSVKNKFRTGPDYGTLRQQLLYHFEQPRPSDAAGLVMGTIETGAEPAHLETLLNIKQRNGDLTHWTLHEDLDPHQLIELIDQGFAEYTVADSHAVTMTARFYPRIKEAFYLSDELPLYWVFGDCADARLVSSAEKFFAAAAADRTLAQILDRYYGHATQLDYPEKLTFIENVDRRLERYRDLFVEAARESGVDWKLPAAVSYQESHWNPQARSPSGVEGLMMLTLETAERLNIEDRKDPSQSIRAGTRFLVELKDRLPPGLEEPDRTWFALAAYNAGFKYVENAMAAARAGGMNPLLWINIRDFLRKPLPANREPGRGQSLNDPYVYVYNVRAYLDMLAWLEGELDFSVHDEPPQAHPPPAGLSPI